MQSTTDTPTLAEKLQKRAVSLAKQGFRVFPLIVDGSTPAYEGWQDKATSDPALAEKLWSGPHDEAIPYNIGIRTGDGLTVLDVDTKRGRTGAESLDDLVTFQGLQDETFTVRTRSGGFHLYYASPNLLLGNSVGEIAPGLDIRSDGGYVVAPGSMIGELSYEVIKPLAIARIQPWFADLCRKTRPRGETVAPLVELDAPDAIARAIDWLRNSSPLVIADSGNGDITAYKVACSVKDFGISEHECLSLILEHFDPIKAHPPQGQEVWERKVENAYRHGTSAPGVKSPMADFEIEELEQTVSGAETVAAKKPKLFLVKGYQSAELLKDYDRRFLVDDLIDAGAMSVVYGDSHAGKTFVMLDIALHVATGRPWNGQETKKGPVVYVAAEGTFGIHARVAAWAKHNGVDMADAWFSTMPCPVDLLRPDGDLKALAALVKQDAASWGDGSAGPAMVVIDTMSRALAGGDENSSVDVGALVKHLDLLRTSTGAHVAVVHHSGKDAARGARGWSGLRAATDTEIEIRDKTLSVTKQREGVGIEPRAFVLETVGLGVDKRGKAIESAVPLYGAAAEMAGPEPLTTEQQRWLDRLAEGVAQLAQEAGNTIADHKFSWQNAAAIWGSEAKLTRQSVEKRLRVLATKAQLYDCKRNQWLMA